eukprot:4922655-Pyramimonas_sp.AAC.1
MKRPAAAPPAAAAPAAAPAPPWKVAGPRSSRRCNDELRTSYQNLLKEGGGSKQDRFRARAWLAKDKAKQKQSNSHLAK